MSWRVAYSLDELRRQVQLAWPERDRRSDGTIGDRNHQSRRSDHNPWVPPPNGGIVTALDLTHDPANGANMHALTAAIRDSRDPRVKYAIWDGRIMAGNGGPSPWVWRNYTGSNQHYAHAHFSVVSSPASLYDSRAAWAMPGRAFWTAGGGVTPIEEDGMRLNDEGPDVEQWQHTLNRFISVTGGGLDGGGVEYDHDKVTGRRAARGSRHIKVDGVFGAKTAEFTGHAIARAERWVLKHPIYAESRNVVSTQTQTFIILAIGRQIARHAEAA